MPTIVITGAASGLGAAFLNHYAANTSNRIYAIDKQFSLERTNLVQSSKAHISYITADITDSTLQTKLQSSLREEPINLLIHSAGIRGLVPTVEGEFPNNVAACETLQVMDEETILRTFQINTLGTFTLLKTLLPNLKVTGGAKVIIMSSRMGSVASNTTGGGYAYRASKAALNAMVRSFALDVPEVTFVLNHPGRVETGLVRCKEEGAISAEESVAGLVKLIEEWGSGDSGRFYDRFGETIPW